MASKGPIGFDFSQYSGPKPKKEEKKDDGDVPERKADRKPKNEMLVLSLVSLLSEALPYLRKFASNQANSHKTNQGRECQAVVDKIDAKLKSIDE
jgi:hypothetical protein